MTGVSDSGEQVLRVYGISSVFVKAHSDVKGLL